MEAVMSCLLEDFFWKVDRSYLCARYRRQMLTEYISTVIAGCRESSGCEEACRQAVLSAVGYHRSVVRGNNEICLLGKYHNVLYIAVKLCYDWKLQDSETVASLLQEIFHCEKSFERLIGGAIFGVKLSQMVSGWKSDFNNREENVKALRYFTQHAYKSKSTFLMGDRREKFVDIPLECCGGVRPVWICLQAGVPDVLEILLSHGAESDTTSDAGVNYAMRLGDQATLSVDSRSSLSLLLRCVTSLHSPRALPSFSPRHSVSATAPPLKHLSRIAIRRAMTENFQLPLGLVHLPLPRELIDYIGLRAD